MISCKKIAATLAMAIASTSSFAYVTWTGDVNISQVYITKGCNAAEGKSLGVITVAGEQTQYALPLLTSADEKLFQIFYDAAKDNSTVRINYNDENPLVSFPVVRGPGVNACGQTNPMVYVLGGSSGLGN